MGTLNGLAYPTSLALGAADHTYVECGNEGKAWGCWGGKTGGTVISSGVGSTSRADAIAQPDERAGITCYMINGVCHQAANRILLAAGTTVSGARGYRISTALFGTYGRITVWGCPAPFDRYPSMTGDLPACTPPTPVSDRLTERLSPQAKLDWLDLSGELQIYERGSAMLSAETVDQSQVRNFNLDLFMHMAQVQLGPVLDDQLSSQLREVRRDTEEARLALEATYAQEKGMTAGDFAQRFNDQTIKFQDEMATVCTTEEYESLFELSPDERIVLADPEIVKTAFQ